MSPTDRILVIRLGALGDIVTCFQSFNDIRKAYPDATIALLTSPTFASLARAMPWFDEIIFDERAPFFRIDLWIRLIGRLRRFNPTRVFDLQGKTRQTILYYLIGGRRRAWSGAVASGPYPRPWPPIPGSHFSDFLRAQLTSAGVAKQPEADLNWLSAPLGSMQLPDAYLLLVPSCGVGREYKKWPVRFYAELSRRAAQVGYATVVIGTENDRTTIDELKTLAPSVIDLAGQTTLLQLGTLARKATAAIGNDSGPTHIAAAVGCKTLALMSDHVNAYWSCPKGPYAEWLQGRPLNKLTPTDVLQRLAESFGLSIVRDGS